MCGLQKEKGKKWDLRGQPWVCHPASNCSVARGVEKGLAPAVGPRGAGNSSSHGGLPHPMVFPSRRPPTCMCGLRFLCGKEEPHGCMGSGDSIQRAQWGPRPFGGRNVLYSCAGLK